jgi:Spy/CpxP family protein refolding chaperone
MMNRQGSLGKKWTSRVAIALGPAVTVASLAACGGSASATGQARAPVSTQADEQAASDVSEHHRHHHHGGVAMFIAMSLDTLGVTPEQRTAVDKIEADLFARMEPARAAEQAVLETLADGIAAGAIDSAKVNAALAQLASASAGIHDASTDALNQLHATLTPEQRGALVDKVEAHWALWQQANADEVDVTPSAPTGGHLRALTADLALTPDQVAKIKANLTAAAKDSPVKPDPQKVEAHLQAFGAAFRSDSFDAKSLSTGGAANAHLASWGATRVALMFESVTPVLTPDQRAKLAAQVREHAEHKESPTG